MTRFCKNEKHRFQIMLFQSERGTMLKRAAWSLSKNPTHLLSRSNVTFRISSVLSARPLKEGWGSWRWLTGSFISPSLSLNHIRPSLLSLESCHATVCRSTRLHPSRCLPTRYITCHPYLKEPSQIQGLPHTHTHTHPEHHERNEIWLLWMCAAKGAIEYVGEWGPLLW